MELMQKRIKLSYSWVAIGAYIYILLPVFIFFGGWLKSPVAMFCSLFLVTGFLHLIKKEYSAKEYFSINIVSLLLIIIVSGIWVYTSGIGGFWPQREDWYWRNALLRDLIDYTWPVIYPETGNALVYYFNYFLPSALLGKLFGWEFANFSLVFFTWLGVFVTILLLVKNLKATKTSYIIVILTLLVVWQGMNPLRKVLLDALSINDWNYQYSSNNTLIQWVVNQTIAPWIAVLLFLERRKISTYVYLGMCVFASAPFPFIGLCILMVGDGIYQLTSNYHFKVIRWIRDIISVPNICAVVGVFVPICLFYVCNTASSGATGTGGIGLYVPLTEVSAKTIFSLSTFLFFNCLIFVFLLYKENKKDHLFWLMTISLLIIPLFRVGIGNDFGTRASIPALFLMMIYSLKFFLYEVEYKKTIRYTLMIGLIGIACANIFNEWFSRLNIVLHAETSQTFWKDDIYTFSNKINEADYCGMKPINFLTESPQAHLFFRICAKEKKDANINDDISKTEKKLEELNFLIPSGEYLVSTYSGNQYIALTDMTVGLGNTPFAISISNTVISGKYEVYFSSINMVMKYSDQDQSIYPVVDYGNQTWGNPYIPENQLFGIIKKGEYYLITWNNTLALTARSGRIEWDSIDMENKDQLWSIKKIVEER